LARFAGFLVRIAGALEGTFPSGGFIDPVAG